jgi:hypothetical protein
MPAAIGVWLALKPPPPPSDFRGAVTDRITSMPIAGVEVDIMSGNNVAAEVLTDAQGQYEMRPLRPRPTTINMRFRKDGYQAEQPLYVPTGKPWNHDMVQLH